MSRVAAELSQKRDPFDQIHGSAAPVSEKISMSTKTTMHGLPKRKKMVVKKKFSKFFFDYIFYMFYMLDVRLREFLGVSGNENSKTYIFFAHANTI